MLKSKQTNMVISDHFELDRHGLQSNQPSPKDNYTTNQAFFANYEHDKSPQAAADKVKDSGAPAESNQDKIADPAASKDSHRGMSIRSRGTKTIRRYFLC